MSACEDEHRVHFRSQVPSLDGTHYKGQAGRIAVIGGSEEYTGAPFFSAMSAMRGGADLSFVFCPRNAAQIIKSYSPDLIVYPGFDALGNECTALARMHAIVVGPGLGRTDHAAEVFEKVLSYAIRSGTVLVIDADALWFLSQSPNLFAEIANSAEGFHVYLTPNKVELDRLLIAAAVDSTVQLVKLLKGKAVIIAKGNKDVIVSLNVQAEISTKASQKRVGGQGDILSGLLALYAFWMLRSRPLPCGPGYGVDGCLVTAAVAACSITRDATYQAFLKHRHGFVASDALAFVAEAVSKYVSDG
ncbi:ATP-dependent (S)-NAD(P)H-hydrate dehydratase [Gracilariopsis chorda]|uniref:ATP-dependent (S)-NAD(P)H-hydrate dehydratase n=1 Tax=Gracilariopsis chorda TaxID=448386 RepID=A0A2V3IQS3_9FLOR|nr:ATP-dependent (S)-NAD(P)H-hydrate dehydratase [Gracilariopsis chorda]|eukprot:PXF43500.1 ATP-dependent (S)-NAD(P)H-hydrate dehydratase [Gracilariopsis chorda]